MVESRRPAGLLGPTLLAMLVAEFPLVQPHLYDSQIPPVIYLSGVLMVVALILTYQGYRRPRTGVMRPTPRGDEQTAWPADS